MGAFWWNSSGCVSMWMNLTSLEKRGDAPKCKIQLRRAPATSTTSASFNALKCLQDMNVQVLTHPQQLRYITEKDILSASGRYV